MINEEKVIMFSLNGLVSMGRRSEKNQIHILQTSKERILIISNNNNNNQQLEPEENEALYLWNILVHFSLGKCLEL